ncbi:BAQ_1a_G0043450.mRNA.1.CDS.1 [Saccharomyces cerevisiae]|nr:BAQ_1a_G0043450.mRNA.1.CDS.1 [Saccharomyces cerevisiae]CAI4726548.1 BAM_G0043430.mRNA.1.CDS.1 [Saccharomyces cerevisiae]CAI7286509.1 BAM_G0043430.mRNA.1.CDS.1 [Saccharomyces cerevisiae]CAI7288397.1 BAQ_1a_G0043450.mRNA.1.CDS.1 [Saccharomyces cerevisiae]
MPYPEKFEGIAIQSHEDWKNPKKTKYDPKPFYDHDIDIKIEACGVCGSDIHCAAGHWGNMKMPLVVGHEIVGKVVKLGPKSNSGLKVGQRVGVGAQVFSCLECDRCKNDNEPYCTKFVTTYSQPYEDGYVSQGGYANYVRVHEHFVVPIPENIPSHLAAPLLCGGLTVYSPLVRNGCGPGKKVGIVGLGGIGSMGTLISKAMGAETYVISRSSRKREDAMKMGADHYIATLEEGDWGEKYFDTFDLIVVCASSLTDIDFNIMPKAMKVGGRIVSISIPEQHEMLSLKPYGLKAVSISYSALGSIKELNQLLKLVSEKDIKIWVETLPVGEAGVHEAFERMEKGDVRYRFTLVGYDKEFSD